MTLAEWLEFAVFSLPTEVPFSWATIGRLEQTISKDPYFSFLMKHFMYSDDAQSFTDTEDFKAASCNRSEEVYVSWW